MSPGSGAVSASEDSGTLQAASDVIKADIRTWASETHFLATALHARSAKAFQRERFLKLPVFLNSQQKFKIELQTHTALIGPFHDSRITGPPRTRNSKAKALPSNCCGRNTPNNTPTAATAILSSATAIHIGAVCKSAPCDRLTRPERSALSITAGRRFLSLIPVLVNFATLRASSPCWALRTTPTPRPHSASRYPTG